MGLTYFSGEPTDVDRDLTEEEYSELQTLIGELYRDLFRADPLFATDFVSFTPTFSSPRNYTAGAVFPTGEPPSLAVPFDSSFEFASGTSLTNLEVLQKMLDADYQAFITDYLKRQPVNQLDRVQQVRFNGETV